MGARLLGEWEGEETRRERGSLKPIIPLRSPMQDDVTRLLGQSKAVLEKLKYRKAFQLLKPLLHDYRR